MGCPNEGKTPKESAYRAGEEWHGMSDEQIDARFRLCTLVMKMPDNALDEAERELTRILSLDRRTDTVRSSSEIRGPVRLRPEKQR